MKKIEAIVKTEVLPDLRLELEKFEIYGISTHNISSMSITSRSGAVGRGGGVGEFLTKIELIVSDRDAKKVIEAISNASGGKGKEHAKIFISSLEEIVDVSHMQSIKDLENPKEEEYGNDTYFERREGLTLELQESDDSNTEEQGKRSRLVPLQKYTLMRVLKFYNANKDILKSEYRIKSFSDFVNFCILGYLPIIESELKQQTIEGRSKLLRI
jgi:nitrogen regulatory protein P-II 1